MQVALERTKPDGRVVGIDIIPAQPPKGVSTIQGNFLSKGVQAEVKRFLQDPSRGRPISALFSSFNNTTTDDRPGRTYMENGGDTDEEPAGRLSMGEECRVLDNSRKLVDVVLSDMSEPFPQTTGFWKRSLSDPYIRMMNTSGINFKDHAGSMVCLLSTIPPVYGL